jgi:hypothetical protein
MTTVLAPEVVAGDARLLTWQSPVIEPLRVRLAQRLRIGEVGILTFALLALYVYLAWWLRYDIHYFVNDALARTSDGVFISVGRDPHLGAVGFYWPPLPQLIQAPFVAILEPFGHSDMAGPMSSALCTALTIPVLGRLCTRLSLGRPFRFGVCLLFGLAPVTLLYAADGMSEACSVLFIAIAMLGFISYIRTRTNHDLVVMSLGLSGAVMSRLETPLLVVVLAVVASFQWREWKQLKHLWTAVLIALPPAAVFLFWMGVQWVLLGSPLFFLGQGGSPVKNYPAWAPNPDGRPWVALGWAGHWVLVLGPALFLLAGLVIWSPTSPKLRGSLGILCGAAVFPMTQIDLLVKHTGYADPRYFMTAVLFATVAVAWMASDRRSGIEGRLINFGLLGVLAMGAITGSRTLSSGWTTHIEGECHFILGGPAKILPFLAKSYPSDSASYCGTGQPISDGLASWKQLDAYLDRTLRPGDRVLADNFSNFYAVLWTKHPDQFVVRNDRDWDKISADPTNYVDYAVTTGKGPGGGLEVLPNGSEDLGHTLVAGDPADWKLVASFPGGVNDAMATATPEVYKYTGPKQ